jgi:type I restriction enzyme S subunit
MTQIRDILRTKFSGEWGKEATSNNSVYVIRTADFTNDGRIKYEQLVKRAIDPAKVEKKRLIRGDVIIEKSGGSPNQPVGRVVFFDSNDSNAYLCNNFTAILRPGNDLIPKYLFYALYYNYIIGKTRPYQNMTTGIINLKLDLYLNEEIYVPDLSIQRQIIAALDKAKALVNMRQQSFEMLDELLRATFLDLFGDPVQNTNGWRTESLGNLLNDIESGWSPKCENYSRESDEDWAVLKLSSVTYKRFSPSENKVLPAETKVKKELVPMAGDVLFSRKNTLELVGAAAYVFDSTKKLLLPDTIFRLVYKTDVLSGIYLWYLLNDSNFNEVVRLLASGATQSMSNISKERLRSLSIPVPNIELQKQFENFVLKSEVLRLRLEEMLQVNQTLFQSLLQRAFHGDLNIDPDLQLDGYLEKENFEAIAADAVLIRTLIDRFNQAKTDALLIELKETEEEETKSFEFESETAYNRAKDALFHLLKQGFVTQETSDNEDDSIKTRLITT